MTRHILNIILLFPLQAVLVRAVVDKHYDSGGGVTYNITFGYTSLGHHAIDTFTSKGLLAIIVLATRFVSSQPIVYSPATVTSTSDSD